MNALITALPLLTVGLSFTTLGALKLYGRWKGIVGGGGKPMACRLRGSCPSWSDRVNLVVTWMIFVIGIVTLGFAIVNLVIPH